MILETKSVEISDEPLGCQLIFSDTESEFDNDDEKYILKIILHSLGKIELD
ncbi:MAG: hypothetical protein KAT33_05045 [Bacteroidales bacterium]|nr:hypothetical protein [Bacteroidales bacterium]